MENLSDHLPIQCIHSVEQAAYILRNEHRDTDHAGRLEEVARLQNYIGEIVVAMLMKEL